VASSAEKAWARALSSLETGQLDEAERSFKKLLEAQPKHFGGLNLLAVVLIQRGRPEEAERYLRRALNENSKSDSTHYNYGMVLAMLNRPAEAAEQFTKALALNPSAETFNSRGTIFNRLGQYVEAIADFDKAISINPRYPDAYSNKGASLAELELWDQSLSAHGTALSLRSDFAEAWVGVGRALSGLGRSDDALSAFDKALAINPGMPNVWFGRAMVFFTLKRYGEALEASDRALALDPNFLRAWTGRGDILCELNRYDEGVVAFDKALALETRYSIAWLGRGNALFGLKDYQEALVAYDKALALGPALTTAWIGRGNCCFELKRNEEAREAHEQALKLEPTSVAALIGLGTVQSDMRQDGLAIANFYKATALAPDDKAAWIGLGKVYYESNRDAEALQSFQRALELDPDYHEAHYNKSLVKLALGDYDEGWRLFESRRKMRFGHLTVRDETHQPWLGETDVSGKTVFAFAEQGLGDTIQFYRYLKNFESLGCHVVFEAPPPLVPLLAEQKKPIRVIARGDATPKFDVLFPLMSAPLAFKTTLGTIPASIPYLSASSDRAALWRNRLGAKRKTRIGLAWSGSPGSVNDVRRSIPLKFLLPIIGDNAEWFLLQKDVRDGDQESLNATPAIIKHAETFTDFRDTAALIAELDLVISVDCVISHLAGAMGKPVWILLAYHADYRYLRDRDDNPWYPTARLFRQKMEGDWTSVIDLLQPKLSEFLHSN